MTEANACADPAELANEAWLPAAVPGTAAAALRASGVWSGEAPLELDEHDIWYRGRFAGGAEETLRFEGLATIADVWLNGAHLLRSENMFLPREVSVRTGTANELHICFRSLSAWLKGKRGHARWRTRLAVPSTLRFARTTLLGRMPGWCPSVHPVGPWRPIERTWRTGAFAVAAVDAHMSVSGVDGRLALSVVLDGEPPGGLSAHIDVGSYSARLDQSGRLRFAGGITIPRVARWWPHTHGPAHLYRVSLRLGDVRCDLGRVGFREISVHGGHDGRGFGLRVNSQEVFCRGACWTTPDIVTLPGSAASYRPWLQAVRDGGMNMVRVGGTMLYEADDFYSVCDELGLLVWQDVMLANFDYPATDEFRASLMSEVTRFLDRTQGHACLAVLCGGSEVLQQAAMLGLTPERIDDTLYAGVIPEIAARIRPDLAYVANSPSGGALPFQPDTGVAHYYGCGAYLRPPDDVRRACVRFASECLALANVPCARSVRELRIATTDDPRWKQGIPRDRGVDWDFEDVRDHYLETLFLVDPVRLRDQDPVRYLDLSRAVSCVLIEHAMGEWRRVGSCCRGALVWQLQDVAPGAGWGLIDSRGRRKPAWYAMQRASRARQLIITDEGLNGLSFHVLNEADYRLDGVLRVACLRDGAIPVRECERLISVEPRGALRIGSAELLPGFFDITYAYRFGPRAHDVTIGTLHDGVDDRVIAEAYHFPAPGILPSRDLGVEVAVERHAGTWWLGLRVRGIAQFLHIEDERFTAEEDWLHLPPGRERRIALRPDCGASAVPEGVVGALNLERAVQYTGRA